MLTRVSNPKSNRWRVYGGRGITVCFRWTEFKSFLEDMGDRPKGKSLDRIDNDKGYYKDNCRWATPAEQAQNRQVTKLSKAIADRIRKEVARGINQTSLARKYGVTRQMIRRIRLGEVYK